MVIAETAAALTSLKHAMDLAKAMKDLSSAEAFNARALEMQALLGQALGEVVVAREAQSEQLDRIHALEAEVAHLKAWDAEKKNYELKQLWSGAMTYMLKPEARGAEPAHWLCPNCYTQGRKSFFQPTDRHKNRNTTFVCSGCKSEITSNETPVWLE